jgi:hypothetical protein
MIYNLESATFTILGNFITSCYTRNWAWQDLLRQPVRYKGERQREKFLVFPIPNWVPYNDCILVEGERGLQSKLKDLFLPTQLQRVNDNQSLLILKVDDLNSLGLGDEGVHLVYWPGYRFVIEPMNYSPSITPAQYMLLAFDYILRASGNTAELDLESQALSTPSMRLEVRGANRLDSIHISEDASNSYWSLEEKRIRLQGLKFQAYIEALREMTRSGARLENCKVELAGDSAELSYVE